MAFKYYGSQPYNGSQPLPGLQYPQQQQQQQPGIDPSTAMSIGSMFMGGGAGGGAGGAGGAAGGAGGAGGGGAGGSGMAGGLGAAGPWAALAAIIAANEYTAVKGGYRSEDKGEYARDVFSGEVFHQDMEQRWLPALGLDEGTKANKWASFLANPYTLDPQKTWKRIKGLF